MQQIEIMDQPGKPHAIQIVLAGIGASYAVLKSDLASPAMAVREAMQASYALRMPVINRLQER